MKERTKTEKTEAESFTPEWAKKLNMAELSAVNYIVAREILSRMQQLGTGRIPG